MSAMVADGGSKGGIRELRRGMALYKYCEVFALRILLPVELET